MRGQTFELARVTVEFTTPSRVGAGGHDPLHDAFFATDANELPALPGTSLAGVLRHAAVDAWGEKEVKALFGFQDNNDGASSKLEVSWGQVHGADDQPVPFAGASEEDPVLAALRAGVIRDHVRLDTRGTPDNRGKFDELLVPAGARFTFELVLHAGASRRMADVLGLLASPALRLGGGGRKGLGRFVIRRAAGRAFDARSEADRAAFARLPRGLHEPIPAGLLPDLKWQASSSSRFRTGRLVLEPVDHWRIGRGAPSRPEHEHEGKPLDELPVEAQTIRWVDGRGTVGPLEPVVPASAVKGALRHRADFHARVAAGAFWDPSLSANGVSEREETEALFGMVKKGEDGAPGRVLLGDGRVSGHGWGRLQHVSLDRFTQGPLDHHLFSEAVLYGGLIELDLAVDVRGLEPGARAALSAALTDLCEGRLPIGAGSNRGHGTCRGSITWDGAGLEP